MTPSILAVDLGLRCGLARFHSDGNLDWFRSQHFANVAAVKRAVFDIIHSAEVQILVVEGDKRLAAIWQKIAEKQDLAFLHPSPERWRTDVFVPRERRRGSDAKAAARVLAEKIILGSGVARRHSPTTDAAEAICLGHWAVRFSAQSPSG